ncbi:MAG: hypothetical protein NZ528_12360 [Caldilineales bacterium]|nr:hypothetical protein [Caldilineales bacterium]MDW8316934.1 hypothetical protein [Anaerolineae bacterium]
MDGATCAVEVYSGARYAERPLAVHWQGRRLAVTEVLSAWRTPVGPAFAVVLSDGTRLRLEFDEQQDRWTATESTEAAPVEE